MNVKIHVNEQTYFSLKRNLKNAGFQNTVFHFEFNADWFRSAVAFGKAKWFVDPVLKVLEFAPIKYILEKTPLKVLFATDIYVVARK